MTTTLTIAPKRPVTEDLFLDITTSAINSMNWLDGDLSVEFADDLTDSQKVDCMLRMGSTDDDQASLFVLGIIGIVENQAYTGDPDNWAANQIAQTNRMADQINALFRLFMGDLADLTPPGP